MTVGELIEKLNEFPAKLEVIIRTETADGDSFCGGVGTISVDSGCTDTDALMIDCNEEEVDDD